MINERLKNNGTVDALVLGQVFERFIKDPTDIENNRRVRNIERIYTQRSEMTNRLLNVAAGEEQNLNNSPTQLKSVRK